MRGTTVRSGWSMLAAPVLALGLVVGIQQLLTGTMWPWWWSGVLALAWAPMLWLPRMRGEPPRSLAWRALGAVGMVAWLSLLASLAHLVPFGVADRPAAVAGLAALAGMVLLYLGLAAVEWRPRLLEAGRRWSYAGFYVDEFFTRLALQLWPTRWAPPPSSPHDTGVGRPVRQPSTATGP